MKKGLFKKCFYSMLLNAFLTIILLNSSYAATITSAGTGTSGTPSAWATGASWVGGVAPTTTDDVIIAAGDFVTTPAVTRTGVTTTVNGTLILTGAITLSGGATLAVNGTLDINIAATNPNVPTATWGSSSELKISGALGSVTGASGWSQSFNNVTWTPSTQTGTVQLGMTGSVTWSGNFTIVNTHSGKVRFTSTTGTTNTINGLVSIQGGILEGTGSGGIAVTHNFNGGLSLSGNGQYFPVASSATNTVSIGGDFSMSGTSTLSKGSGAVTFRFNKAGVQNFTKTGGSILNGGSGVYTFNVASGATLNMGTNVFNSASNNITFNVLSGGGINFGDPDGIVLATGAGNTTGNVRLTGTTGTSKSFSTGGNYTFNGSAAQVTGTGLPATVNSLTINNAAGVTLTNGVTVTNTLAINNGALKTGANAVVVDAATGSVNIGATGALSIDNASGSVNFNNRSVTIESAANGSGSILNIQGTLSGTNNVTIQRFIPAKAARKFSFLASPIGGVTLNGVDGWQQQIHITGSGSGGTACVDATPGNQPTQHTNGFDATATNSPSFYYYDGSATANNRWKAITATNGTNVNGTDGTLKPGKGYRANVRGTRAQGCALLGSITPPAPDAVTLSARGALSSTVNMGDVTVTLDGVDNDYTLLGNPYPATLDFSLFNTDNTSLANKYWFYSPENPSGGGTTTYSAYSAGSMTNKPTGYTDGNSKNIASGQSFFVQKNGVATVTFKEAHKVADQSGSFRTQSYDWSKAIRAALQTSGGNHLDEVLIRFSNETGVATNYTDAWDARSLNEGTQTIVSLKNTDKLAIQTRPLAFVDDTVKLGINITDAGSYQLGFSEFQQFTNASIIKLRDKFLNAEQDIRSNSNYPFAVTADANSKGDNRFELVFKGNAALPVSYIGINAKNKGTNEVEVSWQLPSEKDINKYEVERSGDGRSFTVRGSVASRGNSLVMQSYSFTDAPRLAGSSYYRVKATDKAGQINYSPVVKVSNSKDQMSVAVYPNPVKDVLNLVMQHIEGNYTVRIATAEGKIVQSQSGSIANGNILRLNVAALTVGMYMVEITDSKGNKVIEKMVKQ